MNSTLRRFYAGYWLIFLKFCVLLGLVSHHPLTLARGVRCAAQAFTLALLHCLRATLTSVNTLDCMQTR